MDISFTLLVLASIGGFFMAFNNGANDVSNAFASAVGSKSVGMRQALVLASVFTFLGAIFFGGKVALKLVEGLVEPGVFVDPEHYALAMLSVLFSAGLFVFFSTLTSLPVSCTHSIVGSLTGVNLAVMGWSAIKWKVLGLIALSWVVSPILAGVLAWCIIYGMERLLFPAKARSFRRRLHARLPLLVAVVLSGGLLGILASSAHPWFALMSWGHRLLIAVSVFGSVWLGLRAMVPRWTKRDKKPEEGSSQAFKHLQAWTACAVAFGNGANDVSNSISPVLAVTWVLSYGHLPTAAEASGLPVWILLIGGLGIVLGIMTLGHRVMDTLGRKITTLTPQRGFAIDLSVASVVISASAFGMPISTTHAATGSIIGAGLSRGSGGIRFGILAKIFLAWILTVPLAATITVGIYTLLAAVMRTFFNWV